MSDDKEERSLVSFKDMVMAYKFGGLADVESLHNKGNVGKVVHKQAIKKLQDSDNDCRDYEAWYQERWPLSASPGRTPPVLNETRPYSAQQGKAGGTFIRLPLDLLGVKKQQQVNVTFKENGIWVEVSKD